MPILGVIASSTRQGQNVDTGAMFALQNIIVGSSSASSITFSNIPNTYKHLQIRGIARTARTTFSNDGLVLQFNSDTNSNYSRHQLTGDGANFDLGSAATSTFMFTQVAGNGGIADMFGAFVIDVLDYANSNKYKTARFFSGEDNNSGANQQTGFISLSSGSWRNTNAITSITLSGLSGNLLQYTQCSLYAVKGA